MNYTWFDANRVSWFRMAGEELLIADSGDRDREGLRKLFDDLGYVCTASGDPHTVQELVKRKHFPAAVVDIDFAGTAGGLTLVRFVQENSKPTRVVLLTGRRSFEEAVEAFRLGVVDVISKRPDQLPHLQATVARAINLALSGDKGGALMSEVKAVLEESLRIMFLMGRRLYGGSETSATGLAIKPAILVIDEDQAFLKQVAAELGEKRWDVSVELSGGAGLDRASTFNFQIVAVRQQLQDLPGHTLLRSAQAQQAQTLGVLYSPAGGKAERYEGGRATKSWPMAGAADLVRCLDELVAELSARREERRYMQAFRTEHGGFLKRFAELKSRIDTLTG
jgi:DNA-binding NtrC family response regulator